MAIKRFTFALFVVLLFSLNTVWAKPKKKNNTGIQILNEARHSERSEESPEASEEEIAQSSWQYLEWDEANPSYVLKYEVVIEEYSEKEKSYIEINRLYTEDNTTKVQVQPLLHPGNYRYKVITYNLIGMADVESDYFEFQIFRAFQPEISDLSSAISHTSTLFLEEFNDGIFNVSGRNLFMPKEDSSDISFTTYALVNTKKSDGQYISPKILEGDERNRRLKIQFDMKTLDAGTYNFVATDASGLKSEASKKNEIVVKFKKRVDFDLSAQYSIPVVLFDDTVKTYMKSDVWPFSMSARASMLPFKHRWGYLGMGLTASYTRMFANFDTYKIDGNLITAHANFVYQFPLRFRIKQTDKTRHVATLQLHAGGGMAMFNNFKFHFDHGMASDPLNSLNVSVMAGALSQIYITNRLYTEVSADYIMPFVSDMMFGMFVPSVGIGWQF